MRKFCFGVVTAATLAAAIAPASAQQPATPPAQAASPAAAPAASDTGQSAAPAGAFSYFVNLKNGDTVTSPFKVVFGLSPNMGIAPAGVDKENVGHHHILIDTTLTPEEMTQPLPVDAQHVHFGKGQTETSVTLPPGKHTLQLVLANWTHIPFKPPVQSEIITITVKGESAEKPAAAEEKKEATKEGMTEKKATHRRHVRHYDRSRRYMREHYMHT
jgi:pyruvate/2-oxoglutarate dehydrogenase complex dihydrolipoamide acyltransferase (E2) component